MSAQGGTLARRGAVHLPIWPVAALLGVAVAAAIGMSVLGGGPEAAITSVTDGERFANSSAAVREQGAVLPAIPAVRPIDPAVLEGSTAAIREQGAALPFGSSVNPGMWTLTQAEAYVDGLVTHAVGLENPGAYPGEKGDGTFTPTIGQRPGNVDGEICGQCL